MSIWMVTTGNSDVILQHQRNWTNFYGEIDAEFPGSSSLTPRDPHDNNAGYTFPARVLGMVYVNHPDCYKSDLRFPLLDTYSSYFWEAGIKLERVIIFLTDQAGIFTEDQIIYERCPYWQDTCTLQPILDWYCREKFNLQPEFIHLQPREIGKGIDHWDGTLSLVEQALGKLEYNQTRKIYVSYQAGTPAISSAVQFLSLGKFKDVVFLVSNEYFDEDYKQKSKHQAIPSSNYWRGIQIQKAKQLIISGFPGAALKILEDIQGINQACIVELEAMVNFFNLYNPLIDDSEELTVTSATQRVVDSLDLIGFFLNQKNYLGGITLLAAAQETFLKVAIISQVAMIKETVTFEEKPYQANEMIVWTSLGLFLHNSIKDLSIKREILQKLKFPVNQFRLEQDKDFNVTNRNFALLDWLNNLKPQFSKLSWGLLKWSCVHNRNSDDDVRNQLMHNLRGVQDIEVVDYLLGYEKHQVADVMTAYNNYIKQQFFKAIDHLQLPYTREKLAKKLQKIADSISTDAA
jgi:hypothetical protein